MVLDFDSVADELYGLLPAEFTSTRDTRADEARQAGDRELAAAIKRLKRPTSSAWLVNLLVRRQREQVDELLDLGSAMREAQEQLAGDELRTLAQQRRHVVAALSKAAKGLAGGVGQPVSEETARELETTLDTALAHPTAGDEVRRGRLTTALRYSGLGSLDLGSARPSPPDKTTARPGSGGMPAAGTKKKDDVQHQRQRREAAEGAFLQAATVATTARGDVAELATRVNDARQAHRRLLQAVSDSEAQLAQLQEEAVAAARRVRDTERARETADRTAKVAERRADHARRSLARLDD